MQFKMMIQRSATSEVSLASLPCGKRSIETSEKTMIVIAQETPCNVRALMPTVPTP